MVRIMTAAFLRPSASSATSALSGFDFAFVFSASLRFCGEL
jgi:hypothetical protein